MANASFINLYENQAGYNAETHGVNGSEVSLIDDIEKVVYDGVNVEIPEGVVPGVGTSLWVDSNGGKHFYEGNSVDDAKLTAKGQTFVGIVTLSKGRQAVVLHNTEVESKFINAWAFKVTGYTANTPIVFNQYNKASDAVASTVSGFTPTSDDVASVSAFAAALNSFLTTHQPAESTTAAETNWSAMVMNDEEGTPSVFMFVEGNATAGVYDSQRQTPIASGATATNAIWSLLGYTGTSTTLQRNDNVMSNVAVYNKSRFKQSDTNTGSPTDSVSSTGIYSKTNFTEANCPTLYALYNGNYDAYLDDKLIKYPCSSGVVSKFAGSAETISSKMKSISFNSVVTGASRHLFRFVDVIGSMAGNNSLSLRLSNFEEGKAIFSSMLVDGLDKINASFVKSGSTARTLDRVRWQAAMFYIDSAWLWYSRGNMSSTGFANNAYLFAVATLEF